MKKLLKNVFDLFMGVIFLSGVAFYFLGTPAADTMGKALDYSSSKDDKWDDSEIPPDNRPEFVPLASTIGSQINGLPKVHGIGCILWNVSNSRQIRTIISCPGREVFIISNVSWSPGTAVTHFTTGESIYCDDTPLDCMTATPRFNARGISSYHIPDVYLPKGLILNVDNDKAVDIARKGKIVFFGVDPDVFSEKDVAEDPDDPDQPGDVKVIRGKKLL